MADNRIRRLAHHIATNCWCHDIHVLKEQDCDCDLASIRRVFCVRHRLKDVDLSAIHNSSDSDTNLAGNDETQRETPRIALALGGGGARAAYQVGVL